MSLKLARNIYRLPGSDPAPQQIGSLVDNTADFYNSANYTTVGAPSVTYGASSITFAAAGLFANFDNGIVFNNVITNRSKLLFQADCTVNTLGHGFALTFKDYLSNASSNFFNILFGFNGTFGVGSISIRKGLTQYASGTYAGTISAGKTYRLTAEFIESGITVTMRDISVGGQPVTTVTANFIYTYNFTNPYMQNTYKCSLCTLGGNYTASNIGISTSQMTLGYLMLGNSKTATAFPNTFANSFTGLLKAANPTKNIYYDASINETVNEWTSRVDDLKKYRAKACFMIDCSNDQRFSVTNIATKHAALIAQLNSVGTTCYLVNMFPETGQDARTLNGTLTPVYTPNVIGVYTDLVNPASIPNPLAAYISPDGIHTNSTAQPVIAAKIQPFII